MKCYGFKHNIPSLTISGLYGCRRHHHASVGSSRQALLSLLQTWLNTWRWDHQVLLVLLVCRWHRETKELRIASHASSILCIRMMRCPHSTSLCVCKAFVCSCSSPVWAVLLPNGEGAQLCPSLQPDISALGSGGWAVAPQVCVCACVCAWGKTEESPAPYWGEDGAGTKPGMWGAALQLRQALMQWITQAMWFCIHEEHTRSKIFPLTFYMAKRCRFSQYVWFLQVLSMSSDLESESGSPLLLLLQMRVPCFLMSQLYGRAKVTGNRAVSKISSKYPLLNPKVKE